MSNESLGVLDILSICRKNLVQRTLEQNHELFRGFFEFESDMQSLRLLFEREKIQFINSNLEKIDSIEDSKESMEFFQKTMKLLIESFCDGTSVEVVSSIPIVKDIFTDKLSMIDGLITVSEKANNKINSMKYQIYKDNRLFERELRKIGGE